MATISAGRGVGPIALSLLLASCTTYDITRVEPLQTGRVPCGQEIELWKVVPPDKGCKVWYRWSGTSNCNAQLALINRKGETSLTEVAHMGGAEFGAAPNAWKGDSKKGLVSILAKCQPRGEVHDGGGCAFEIANVRCAEPSEIATETVLTNAASVASGGTNCGATSVIFTAQKASHVTVRWQGTAHCRATVVAMPARGTNFAETVPAGGGSRTVTFRGVTNVVLQCGSSGSHPESCSWSILHQEIQR